MSVIVSAANATANSSHRFILTCVAPLLLLSRSRVGCEHVPSDRVRCDLKWEGFWLTEAEVEQELPELALLALQQSCERQDAPSLRRHDGVEAARLAVGVNRDTALARDGADLRARRVRVEVRAEHNARSAPVRSNHARASSPGDHSR